MNDTVQVARARVDIVSEGESHLISAAGLGLDGRWAYMSIYDDPVEFPVDHMAVADEPSTGHNRWGKCNAPVPVQTCRGFSPRFHEASLNTPINSSHWRNDNANQMQTYCRTAHSCQLLAFVDGNAVVRGAC